MEGVICFFFLLDIRGSRKLNIQKTRRPEITGGNKNKTSTPSINPWAQYKGTEGVCEILES